MSKSWTIMAIVFALLLAGLPAGTKAAGRLVLLEQTVNVGCG